MGLSGRYKILCMRQHPSKAQGEIILYQSENSTQHELRIEDETVWLSLNQISDLFERDETELINKIQYLLKNHLKIPFKG